jgi:hypothetical protein
MRVDLDPAVFRADAGIRDLQLFAVRLSALRVEHRVAAYLFAAFQHGERAVPFAADLRHAFLHVEGDAHAEKAVGQHAHHVFA